MDVRPYVSVDIDPNLVFVQLINVSVSEPMIAGIDLLYKELNGACRSESQSCCFELLSLYSEKFHESIKSAVNPPEVGC